MDRNQLEKALHLLMEHPPHLKNKTIPWELARDLCQIIPKITQSIPIRPLPAETDTEGWASFLRYHSTMFFYLQLYESFPNYELNPQTAIKAIRFAAQNDYNPPIWAVRTWLIPGLDQYVASKGKDPLEKCFKLTGKQRVGNYFDQIEMETERTVLIYQMFEIITAMFTLSGKRFSSAKASQLLKTKIKTHLSHGMIDEIYKKRNKEIYDFQDVFEDSEHPHISAINILKEYREAFKEAAESKDYPAITIKEYEHFIRLIDKTPK